MVSEVFEPSYVPIDGLCISTSDGIYIFGRIVIIVL